MMESRIAALLLVVVGIGAHPAWAVPTFVDVTVARNIDFVGTYGPSFGGLSLLEEIMQRNMGNGAAVGDYDGDGDLDIYLLAQLGRSNRLLRNDLDQGIKWFTDVTEIAGVGDTGLSRVAHFVDLNNDGHLDLIVVNDDDGSGAHSPSKIYRNDGDGAFTDVTPGSGFDPVGYLRCGAAVADYNQDGLLDIYVTNWGAEGGSGNPLFPGSNRLYRNLGGFAFQDVTLQAGLGELARDSFTAIFHDFNGDRFPDLYVAVDHTSDEFYWNLGGLFTLATLEVGATHTGNDMGIACADFDDDGDLDLYATNITDPDGNFGTTQFNVLYVNQEDVNGETAFLDQAFSRGVYDTYWGWGTEWTDVENDGDLDLVAVTGFDEFILDQVGSSSAVYQTPSVLLTNDGTGYFTTSSPGALSSPDDSRALIAFDYDRDGDEDLLITNVNQPARLFENVSDAPGHWLEIRLVQAAGANRNGIGATVQVTAGGLTRRRDIMCGDSYLAGTPAEIHLGLGSASVVDMLHVSWTDGSESSYTALSADRFIEITQGVADADLDGVTDASDCDPGDDGVWDVPSAVSDLTLTGGAAMTLNWTEPAEPGATTVFYDVLRGDDPLFSGNLVCLQQNTPSPGASDPTPPEGIFFYLVRVRNGCGETSGTDSTGASRLTPDCP